MKKTLRNKLLLWFLLFSGTTILLFVPYNLYYLRQKDQLLSISDVLNEVYIEILREEVVEQYFLNFETIRPAYFESRESIFLEQHLFLQTRIDSLLTELLNNQKVKNLGITPQVENTLDLLGKAGNTFHELEVLIYERGFENYGIVGEMRHNVHKIENSNVVKIASVLSIRRREKDYIIRNQQVYIDRLNVEAHTLKKQIINASEYNRTVKDSLYLWLDNYQSLFNKLVDYDRKIGLKDNTGLYQDLHQSRELIILGLQGLIEQVQQKQASALRYFRYQYYFVVGFLIVMSIVASFVFSKKITQPLFILSESITRFVKSSFTLKEDIPVFNSDDQIGKLTHNFIVMRNKIMEHIDFFKQKVEERTREITNQKDEILAQKEEIEAQNGKLEHQKTILEDHNRIMRLKNKHILDSILYAKNIQNTILPDTAFIHNIFPQHFIHFQPKDIVSGDFYWFNSVEENGRKYAFFAAVDCTGHGVPGALMSILAHNGLQRAINTHGLTNPAHVLQTLNSIVFQSLNHYQNESKIFDSIDIACCRLDLQSRELLFCGAFRPAVMVRGGKLEIFHGNRVSIGNSLTDAKALKEYTIQLQKDDMIYLFSDGYADQFGGPQNKKFKNKRFYDLLQDIYHEPLPLQHGLIKQTIGEWAYNTEQIDDQLIIGIRV